MTPEDSVALALFKAGSALIRSATEHAASETGDEKQAEFFYRELEQECNKLVPKFRRGNGLSSLLAKKRLPVSRETVVDSASG